MKKKKLIEGSVPEEALETNPQEQQEDEILPHHVDNAVDDLLRAEQHKRNPKLMARVHKKIDEKHAAITSLKQLRQVAQDKLKE